MCGPVVAVAHNLVLLFPRNTGGANKMAMAIGAKWHQFGCHGVLCFPGGHFLVQSAGYFDSTKGWDYTRGCGLPDNMVKDCSSSVQLTGSGLDFTVSSIIVGIDWREGERGKLMQLG